MRNCDLSCAQGTCITYHCQDSCNICMQTRAEYWNPAPHELLQKVEYALLLISPPLSLLHLEWLFLFPSAFSSLSDTCNPFDSKFFAPLPQVLKSLLQNMSNSLLLSCLLKFCKLFDCVLLFQLLHLFCRRLVGRCSKSLVSQLLLSPQ